MATDGADDFDRLGAAVGRVLREAFQTAEDVRREGVSDAGALAAQVGANIERSLREALGVQSNVRREAEEIVESVRTTVASAQRAVEEIIAAAKREAEQLRLEAAAEAQGLVANAETALQRAQALVEAERVAFDHDLTRVVAELQQAVDAVRADSAARRRMSLERASAEAASILRQARMQHRAAAAEVDRMIEAAAAEAAALRKAAREDALRFSEQMSGVVEMGDPPVEQRSPRSRGGARQAG